MCAFTPHAQAKGWPDLLGTYRLAVTWIAPFFWDGVCGA